MNNKGFTLVELLATIVILGLVTSFVFVTVTDYYSASKDKSEEVFYKQIETYMDDYIAISGSKGKSYTDYGTVRKYYCESFDENGNCTEEKYDEVTLKVSDDFDIDDVVSEVVDDELINPKKTEVLCTGDNTNIKVYRDSDYVYCYVIKPNGPSCIDKTINTCEGRYKDSAGYDITLE